MMGCMRSSNVQDGLQRDFEPAPLPAAGPDGGLNLEPQRVIPPDRPSLCQAGPCQNYHRFEVMLEVAQPIAIRLPDGRRHQPGPVTHTSVNHYCYPTVGIELELNAPIVSCNRFAGGTAALAEHEVAVAAWEAAWAAEREAAQETDSDVEALMAQHEQAKGDGK